MSGGGGGSDQAYYAGQDALASIQANIAQNLYNQYAAYAPNTLYDLATMADYANSGEYEREWADTLSQAARDNAAVANENERAATNRALVSMGVNPADARFVGTTRATELSNAANTAGQMNQARLTAKARADDMGWSRTADFYNMLAGMPTQSSASISSASNIYSNMANQQNQATNAANSALRGYGQYGQNIVNGMMASGGSATGQTQQQYARGGYVRRGLRPREPGFATGGMVKIAGNGPVAMGQINTNFGKSRPGKIYGASTMDALGAIAAPVAATMAGQKIKGLMAPVKAPGGAPAGISPPSSLPSPATAPAPESFAPSEPSSVDPVSSGAETFPVTSPGTEPLATPGADALTTTGTTAVADAVAPAAANAAGTAKSLPWD